MYQYRAACVRVVDGDTIDFQIDLGFFLTQVCRVRLRGINTPELHGETAEKGREAKAYVEFLLQKAATILLRTYKTEKFGRWLADVWVSDVKIDPEGYPDLLKYPTLNQILLNQNLAVKAFED